MNILSILSKKVSGIVHSILTALYEGLARFGCGIAGIPYESD
jgi:hypothetical protein